MMYSKLFKVLTGDQFKLYVYLCENYGFCWSSISQTNLAESLSLSRSNINVAIKSLTKMNLLEKDSTKNGKENRYRVLPVVDQVYGEFFVYVLELDGVVVYVGSTTDLVSRISDHRKDKAFDNVKYCVLPNKKLMLDVERYGIYKLKPILNTRICAPSIKPKEIKLKWEIFKAELNKIGGGN